MTATQKFMDALTRGRARAEDHVPEMAATYERVIHDRSRYAAHALVAEASLTASDWQPPPEGVLYTSVSVPVALRAQQRQAVERVAGEALEAAGIPWDANSQLVRDLLALTEAWTGAAITDAVQPLLREVVTDAFAAGLSVKDAAALIRSKFDAVAPARAEMLARSTLNMLGNGTTQVAVADYNERASARGERTFQVKRWLTAGDAKVRPTHAAASGQERPVNQPFAVGGSSLQFPGDPGGALAEILNCRCTTVYAESPSAAAAAAATQEEPMTLTTVAWLSDVAFEGTATDDGRYMLPDSLDWREPPLTLMAMTVTDDGHDGAYVAGRMDTFAKDANRDMDGVELPKGVTAIRSGGIFDIAGDNGSEIARLVTDETLRGVSVDLAILDWALRDPDTGEILEPDELDEVQMERAFLGELQFAVRKGTIMAATVCPTPAFSESRIAVTASGQRVLRIRGRFAIVTEALTAAAAGLAPLKPPAEWFQTPEPDGPAALTVTDDGQVFGHIAAWNSCHTGRQGECFQPPASPSGYAYFNLGEVECADGTRVACGQITLDTDHAAMSANGNGAKGHYEHTGTCVADVRAVDGLHGIWVAGAVRPNVTAAQARTLMAAKPSGDWRSMTPGGPLELIGVLAVNVPGYPVPRPQLQLVASAAHPEGEPVALIASGLFDDAEFSRRIQSLTLEAEGLAGGGYHRHGRARTPA